MDSSVIQVLSSEQLRRKPIVCNPKMHSMGAHVRAVTVTGPIITNNLQLYSKVLQYRCTQMWVCKHRYQMGLCILIKYKVNSSHLRSCCLSLYLLSTFGIVLR